MTIAAGWESPEQLRELCAQYTETIRRLQEEVLVADKEKNDLEAQVEKLKHVATTALCYVKEEFSTKNRHQARGNLLKALEAVADEW